MVNNGSGHCSMFAFTWNDGSPEEIRITVQVPPLRQR